MPIHPLQSSGKISLNDLNLELGRATGTEISLQKAQIGTYSALKNVTPKPPSSSPFRLSDWFGYNHAIQSSSGGGGGGTVNTGTLVNNTGRTISASLMSVSANGLSVVNVNIPSLANGAQYNFNTSYTNQIFSNGTFIIQFFTPVNGINATNKVYMTGGYLSTTATLSYNGTSYQGTTTSSGPQYAINITLI